MRIRLVNSSREFECGPGESLLDAALAAGFNLAHSCRGGNCGACRALRLEGELHYPNGPPLGLSAAETAEGYALLCQARPRSELLLELPTVQNADQVEARRLPCRIEALSQLTHDVMQVALKLPAAEPFEYRAGQYVDILLPQARRRSYSIVSAPHGPPGLELLVRRVPGGLFSERLFGALRPGALLEIEGPHGRFCLRDELAPDPLLLIGGGTGIAPLLSMVSHLLAAGRRRDIRLYWGVRSLHDLFYRDRLERLVRDSQGTFSYQTVLSAPAEAWQGPTGWVHQVALHEVGTALVSRGFEVYAAGPPAMIGALRAAAHERGLPAERLHVDVFDYAVDPPGASSSAASKP